MANPFSILLDMYSEECENLYTKLMRKVHPPLMVGSSVQMLETKLKKSAFARFCMEMLHEVAVVYPHEDFELFVEEMHFLDYPQQLLYLFGKEGVEWELADDLHKEEGRKSGSGLENEIISEKIFELMKHYQLWWRKEIMRIHNNDIDAIQTLFAAEVFGDKDTDEDGFLDMYRFIEDNFSKKILGK